MDEIALGDRLTVLRPGLLAERRACATLVVCGAAQGMTSVLSYALVRAGIFLGDRLDRLNHEDTAFRRLLLGPGRQGPLADIPPLRGLIDARDAAHVRWGFKLPRAILHLDELEPMLRAPVIVVGLRNPMAIMRSIRERGIEGHEDGLWLLRKGLAAHAALDAMAARVAAPLILCDMDTARADPAAFLDALFAALDIAVDPAPIAAEIALSGYRELPPRPDGI
ncbi:MAG: hypothetical protein ACK4GO_16760 [Gemmobacter sp.]